MRQGREMAGSEMIIRTAAGSGNIEVWASTASRANLARKHADEGKLEPVPAHVPREIHQDVDPVLPHEPVELVVPQFVRLPPGHPRRACLQLGIGPFKIAGCDPK